MNTPKTKKTDVQKLRSTLLLVGLLSSLIIVLGAFSLKVKTIPSKDFAIKLVDSEIEIINIINHEIPKPDYQPPPPIEKTASQEKTISHQVVETRKEMETIEFFKQGIIPPPPVIPAHTSGSSALKPKIIEEEYEQDFSTVSKQAQFKGGAVEMRKFIAKNLIYPLDTKYENIEGRMVVEFIVGINGEILEPKILGKKIGFGCDEEALRVVQAMDGLWIPAEQGDKKVPMRFKLPILFKMIK